MAMKLGIIQIENRGVPGKECLYVAVRAAANLSFYVVFDSWRIGEGLISLFPRHTYWFQPQEVGAGDSVMLFTGPGMNSFVKREDGSAVYLFYWGLQGTIWDESSSCAVLLEVNQWQTSPKSEGSLTREASAD